MSEAVKPARPYRGAARQARTRRTRAAVAAAASSLFAERGYAATTIEAISDRSDTPQATVYRLFSSKLGILKALLDVSVAGDDEAVAMLDRPQVRALLSAEAPKDQLAGLAALVRAVMTRVGPVHRILADAARSDPDAASLLAEIAGQRHEGQRRIASSLASSGALRPGLAERDAADIIHALASPEVHGLLVYDRGWTSERHEEWLRQVLVDQLLPRELPDARHGGGRWPVHPGRVIAVASVRGGMSWHHLSRLVVRLRGAQLPQGALGARADRLRLPDPVDNRSDAA